VALTRAETSNQGVPASNSSLRASARRAKEKPRRERRGLFCATKEQTKEPQAHDLVDRAPDSRGSRSQLDERRSVEMVWNCFAVTRYHSGASQYS
jgi:hypothetical protein